MCELFGFTSKREKVINDYLKRFFERSDMHPHGWGLACMNGSLVNIEKEPIQASKSKCLQERLKEPITFPCVFAHIRYATIGNIEAHNCHPYAKEDSSGRRWILIHNGTIFDYSPLDRYCRMQEGDTDSGRILLYLVDQLNKGIEIRGRYRKGPDRFLLVDQILANMAKGNKLNILLYDGEYVYAHTNYRDSLYYLEKEDDSVLISTSPLTEESWKPLPFTSLQVYKQGSLVYQGEPHGNEYFDNEENMKFLYQTFSHL